ncbi:hypothetical protein LJR289_000719 [Pseudoduganella sp. LjRoot289]|uniref:hypothetical protein n=1 Tax=Pseudoduganella sp. LjRoot289 TaxID=3342314 RepID=UPI003ECC42B9
MANPKLALRISITAIAAAIAIWAAGTWYAGPVAPTPTPAQSIQAPSQAKDGWTGAAGAPLANGTAHAADPVALNRQVDALIATRDPNDAYKAHNLILECITFQQLGAVPFFHFPEQREMSDAEKQAEAKLCASLTEPMRRSRIDYLAIAAKAGVPGASSGFLMAGPFGDPSALETRPDDPLVVEWKRLALAQLSTEAAQGDLTSLHTLWTAHMSGMYSVPKDARLAYTYNAAMERIYRQQNPGENGAGPYSASLFSFLKEGLTPAQISRADEDAALIAENFRLRRAAGKLTGP